MSAIKRFVYAMSLTSNLAHKIYGQKFTVEGARTACGQITRPGWTWVTARGLKRWHAKRCKRCESSAANSA